MTPTKNDVAALESRASITKLAVMRTIAEIKQQFLNERKEAEILREEVAKQATEIATLKTDIARLTEESKVLDEIKQALETTKQSLSAEG